jgi:hypothetical protein
MKEITIKYVKGLGSFLDEENIPFFNNGDNTISFDVENDQQLCDIMIDFGMFIVLQLHNQE